MDDQIEVWIMDFGQSVENAYTVWRQTPNARLQITTFHLWMEMNYKISVSRKDKYALMTHPSFTHDTDGLWGVYRVEDEEIATLFKLEYS